MQKDQKYNTVENNSATFLVAKKQMFKQLIWIWLIWKYIFFLKRKTYAQSQSLLVLKAIFHYCLLKQGVIVSLIVNVDRWESAWVQCGLAGSVGWGDGSLGTSQWIAISAPIWAGGCGRRRLGDGTTRASHDLACHQALSSPSPAEHKNLHGLKPGADTSTHTGPLLVLIFKSYPGSCLYKKSCNASWPHHNMCIIPVVFKY